VYRNDGGGAFSDLGAPLTGVSWSSSAWGDYDNDGDLDILLVGLSTEGGISRSTERQRRREHRPDGALRCQRLRRRRIVTLEWTSATDGETPPDALTYNVRIGTAAGRRGHPAADGGSEHRLRRLPGLGNEQHGTTALAVALLPGVYYWAVQAIDTGFAGSPFSTEGSFTICGYGITRRRQASAWAAARAAWPSRLPRAAGGPAVPNDSWIGVTSGASGSGNGSVGYSVDANPSPARTGTITIAGQTFTVDQPSGCAFSIDPTSANFGAPGGSLGVAVTSGPGCPWTAVSNDFWIEVTSGASGSGTGVAFFSVTANVSPARTGTLTIAGHTFTVSQSSGCNYSIDPWGATVGSTGGAGSVAVTSGAGCPWTAVSNDAWIQVTSGSSGSGAGSVGYSVEANVSPARTGSITIAGQTFVVNQADGCSYAIDPTSASFGAGSGTGSVAVTAGAGCAWTAVRNYAWIEVTSGASGSGSGTVGYSVATNTGPARAGTMTIAATRSP